MKRPAPRRKSYDLDAQELSDLDRLRRDVPGVAFAFWRKVAARRDLDYKTIMASLSGDRGKFTALPSGHGKWWCWPGALECRYKVIDGHAAVHESYGIRDGVHS